jgi:ABC-2 type transport system ATP-binding protein
MSVLEVSSLRKSYATFSLKDVSFSIEKGRIVGFIGRNGAGKTTTLKSLLNFIHPDGGEIRFFGESFADHEADIKRRIGFVSGGVDFYPKKRIGLITDITKRFYTSWDEASYAKYLKEFDLDERKMPSELSAGMKVKYALALALSHRAEFLILDEPTSGLDPVSRDDLLDVFRSLASEGVTVLFSTHITSDLDKCADDIIYIKEGEIIAESGLESFLDGYRAAELTEEQVKATDPRILVGLKPSKRGYAALVRTTDAGKVVGNVGEANLETIMVHLDREGRL